MTACYQCTVELRQPSNSRSKRWRGKPRGLWPMAFVRSIPRATWAQVRLGAGPARPLFGIELQSACCTQKRPSSGLAASSHAMDERSFRHVHGRWCTHKHKHKLFRSENPTSLRSCSFTLRCSRSTSTSMVSILKNAWGLSYCYRESLYKPL
jgi:hypothetical protein